jgi:hypothetical protein
MMIAAMTFFAGGCVTDSEDDSDDTGGSTSTSAETYLPFKQGSVWTFVDTETEYWSNPPTVNTSSSTTTCTGQTTIDGKTYWVMQENDGPMYFRVQGNDVYSMNAFADIVGSYKPAAKATQDMLEVLMFRFGVSKGTTWDIWSYTDTQTEYSMTITIKGKFAGTETVTTPAGSYANSAKFEFTTSVTSTSAGFTHTFSTTSSMWFAPNVGPIKFLDREEQFGTALWQAESVLSSYVP